MLASIDPELPTAPLRRDHCIIVGVLESLTILVRQPERTSAATFILALEFLSEYGDRLHTVREEVLLRMMEERGQSRPGGPPACLLTDLAQARGLRKGMADAVARLSAGSASAGRDLAACVADFAAMIRFHIRRADEMLFPQVDSLFSDAPEELKRRLDEVERQQGWGAALAGYERVADRLREAAGLERLVTPPPEGGSAAHA
jgi:hemerythrin-like domain-containing protein